MKDKTYTRMLVVIILLGFILHILFAGRIPVTPDEGGFLYDSYLITKGLIPFRDYDSRAPLLIYVLSFLISVFGNKLMVGRIFMSSVVSITAFVLYHIGGLLFDKKAGFLSAVVYALTPFLMLFGTSVSEEPVAVLLISGGICLLIKSLKEDNTRISSIAGSLFAMALFVRVSALSIFLFIPLILFISISNKGRYNSLSIVFYVGAGFVITFLFFVLCYSMTSGFSALQELYKSNIALSTQKLFSEKNPLFSYNSIYNRYISVFNSIPMIFHLVLPFFVFIHIYFKQKFNLKIIFTYVIYIFFVILFLINIIKMDKVEVEFNRYLLLFVFYGILIYTLKYHTLDDKSLYSMGVVFSWFISITFFYFFVAKFREHYLVEFIPSLSIMLGFVLTSIKFENLRSSISALVFVMLISGLFIPAYTFIYFREPQAVINSVYVVSGYLRDNTGEGDIIFTARVVYAYLAGRRVVYDISHSTISFNGRTVDDIILYLDSNKVKFVASDFQTKNSFLERYPKLEKYVNENYKIVRVFGTDIPDKRFHIQIYERESV